MNRLNNLNYFAHCDGTQFDGLNQSHFLGVIWMVIKSRYVEGKIAMPTQMTDHRGVKTQVNAKILGETPMRRRLNGD